MNVYIDYINSLIESVPLPEGTTRHILFDCPGCERCIKNQIEYIQGIKKQHMKNQDYEKASTCLDRINELKARVYN